MLYLKRLSKIFTFLFQIQRKRLTVGKSKCSTPTPRGLRGRVFKQRLRWRASQTFSLVAYWCASTISTRTVRSVTWQVLVRTIRQPRVSTHDYEQSCNWSATKMYNNFEYNVDTCFCHRCDVTTRCQLTDTVLLSLTLVISRAVAAKGGLCWRDASWLVGAGDDELRGDCRQLRDLQRHRLDVRGGGHHRLEGRSHLQGSLSLLCKRGWQEVCDNVNHENLSMRFISPVLFIIISLTTFAALSKTFTSAICCHR